MGPAGRVAGTHAGGSIHTIACSRVCSPSTRTEWPRARGGSDVVPLLGIERVSFQRQADRGSLPKGARRQLSNNGALLMELGRAHEAIDHLNRSIELLPASEGLKNASAWQLEVYPNPFGARALELAQQLVKMRPDRAAYWSRLGAGQVRCADYANGRTSIERAMRASSGGDVDDWLFMAMASYHLGDKAKAQSWYEKAACVLVDPNRPKNPPIDHLWREATVLLGSSVSPSGSLQTTQE